MFETKYKIISKFIDDYEFYFIYTKRFLFWTNLIDYYNDVCYLNSHDVKIFCDESFFVWGWYYKCRFKSKEDAEKSLLLILKYNKKEKLKQEKLKQEQIKKKKEQKNKKLYIKNFNESDLEDSLLAIDIIE